MSSLCIREVIKRVMKFEYRLDDNFLDAITNAITIIEFITVVMTAIDIITTMSIVIADFWHCIEQSGWHGWNPRWSLYYGQPNSPIRSSA